jgi:hypothetical protein
MWSVKHYRTPPTHGIVGHFSPAEPTLSVKYKGTVPDRKQAVAWIQSSLEPVCGRGQTQGQAHPVLGKRVSWNPAEMGEIWQETRRNILGT